MQFFEEKIGTISSLTKDGAGRIAIEGKRPIDILGTLPEEEVTYEIVRRVKGAYTGRLKSIKKKSPHRTEPRCQYAGHCGGCKWQHINYDEQVNQKYLKLLENCQKAELPLQKIEITTADEIFFYRNRMDYVFGPNGELGLREAGKWWAPIDLVECHLLSPETPTILEKIKKLAHESGLPFWKPRSNTGFFRYLVIREGKRTNERMIMLVTNDVPKNFTETWEKFKKSFVEELAFLATSIVWGINNTLTDTSKADTMLPLLGKITIMEKVNDLKYQISPNAFFQTNTVMAEKLQQTVLGLLNDITQKTVLDLYCGSGFFTLPLAKSAKKVIGIELVEEVIETAKINAQKNNLRADFFVSKAEDFAWSDIKPDAVIIDPPRSGLHPKVIKTILEEVPPEIVYVSCSYPRFLDEWQSLKEKYKLVSLQALDLFPHTPHIEVVAYLIKLVE